MDAARMRGMIPSAEVLEPANPVKPGGTATLTISVIKETGAPAVAVISGTDLALEGESTHIPASHIHAVPSELRIRPGGSADVEISMRMLPNTKVGRYVGFCRLRVRNPCAPCLW
jgi:hypothetical protein